MKYCYQCGKITPGEPLYCQFCGRSYDAKLCPRSHPNSRSAEVCSQCGSRDLSTPQPKVSFLWNVFGFLLRVGLGIFLVFVSIALLVEFVKELIVMPQVQNGLLGLGLLLFLAWLLWSKLPDWLRDAIHHSLKRRGHRDDR
jgi:RNA polymerase subunit RPABC4/transcription elongation factor Spt4